MSTQVLPSLVGLGWSVHRTPMWATRKHQSVSGKVTRIADQSTPIWQWDLTYNFLVQGTTINFTNATDFSTLAGFFNSRQGGFDSFLYTDADDYTVTGAALGTTDGNTTTFQLNRSFGGFVEPILAPHTVTAVKLGGTPQSTMSYTVNHWDVAAPAAPGTIVFNTAPSAGQAVTADFSYYWPCSFVDDHIDFEKFMAALYAVKKVSFVSIK